MGCKGRCDLWLRSVSVAYMVVLLYVTLAQFCEKIALKNAGVGGGGEEPNFMIVSCVELVVYWKQALNEWIII